MFSFEKEEIGGVNFVSVGEIPSSTLEWYIPWYKSTTRNV